MWYERVLDIVKSKYFLLFIIHLKYYLQSIIFKIINAFKHTFRFSLVIFIDQKIDASVPGRIGNEHNSSEGELIAEKGRKHGHNEQGQEKVDLNDVDGEGGNVVV